MIKQIDKRIVWSAFVKQEIVCFIHSATISLLHMIETTNRKLIICTNKEKKPENIDKIRSRNYSM